MQGPDKHSLSILMWFRTFYGIIFLAALWAAGFALTGSILRAFMLVGALALVFMAGGLFNGTQHAIYKIKIAPYVEQFEKEMKVADNWKASDTHFYTDKDGNEKHL